MGTLPKQFTTYQAAVVLHEEFKDNLCSVRDGGSYNGRSVATTSACMKDPDKENGMKYHTLGLPQPANKSTEFYVEAVVGCTHDVDAAQREVYDDIPAGHTVLNQFTSNLTDGVSMERKASELMDKRKTNGTRSYHVVG